MKAFIGAKKGGPHIVTSAGTKEGLILELYEIGAVQFGKFTLKSGLISPIYIDLRRVISFPMLMHKLTCHMWQCIASVEYDSLAGVPYAGLPLATSISLAHNIPMIMPRKEVKQYGAKRAVEGVYKPNDKVVVVEDLVTKGGSVMQVIMTLRDQGLVVEDAVVFLDREQGGREHLANHRVRLHAVCTMREMLEILHEKKSISTEIFQNVTSWLKSV